MDNFFTWVAMMKWFDTQNGGCTVLVVLANRKMSERCHTVRFGHFFGNMKFFKSETAKKQGQGNVK